MKFVLLSVALLVVVAIAHSAPHNSEDNNSEVRQKRSTVTCDLFSWTGDTFCTAGCFASGKKSGTCIGKTCVCKGDSIIDTVGGLTS